jgi:hypothetical protein
MQKNMNFRRMNFETKNTLSVLILQQFMKKLCLANVFCINFEFWIYTLKYERYNHYLNTYFLLNMNIQETGVRRFGLSFCRSILAVDIWDKLVERDRTKGLVSPSLLFQQSI